MLPAGRYIFRLPDRTGARQVLQVLSADQSKVYAMLQGIQRTRPESTDKIFVTFEERAPAKDGTGQRWITSKQKKKEAASRPQEKAKSKA